MKYVDVGTVNGICVKPSEVSCSINILPTAQSIRMDTLCDHYDIHLVI